MVQFDVHENPSDADKTDFPYLLDIQVDLLSELRTRVVVPLTPLSRYGEPVDRLNPVFEIQGHQYVGVFSEIAAIHQSELGAVAGSLSDHRHEIISAIDFLVLGF
jgi:toxin CcdB